MFVVDSSVVLSWLLPDEETELSNILYLKAQKKGLLAPFHFYAEVLNIIMLSERKGRISALDKDTAILKFNNMQIKIDTLFPLETCHNVFTLAQKHTLTYYDALYLELALRHKLELATFDKALARAFNVEN